MKYLSVAAMCAGLLACSQQPANTSGNAAAPASNSVNAASASPAAPTGASPSYGTASAPAAAYRRYFDERWGGQSPPVTPAEVNQMLGTQTPQQVVGALWGNSDNGRWATVASGIAKGDPAWLGIAPRISQGTDAGTSDDFGIAVGDALTTNPVGALRLLSQIEMGAGACTENGFEVPAEQARAFFDAAIAAVETVNDPSLRDIRTACLTELRKGRAAYPGLNGDPPQKL